MVNNAEKLKQIGFTLIELLVVLFIIGVATSLVGGLGIVQKDSADARAERLALEREIKALSYRAFFRADTITLRFSQNYYDVEVTHLSQQPDRRTFSTIEFPAQEMTFSQSGYPNLIKLEYQSAGNSYSLSLYPLLGLGSDEIYVKNTRL